MSPDLAAPWYAGSEHEARNHRLLLDASCQGQDLDLRQLVAAEPQLLNAYVVLAEVDRDPALMARRNDPLPSLLATLEHARAELSSHPSLFPLGHGPIEEVWREQDEGRIGLAHARELVAAPSVSWRLSGAYLRALARHAAQLAQHEDRLRSALALQRLLLASLEGLRSLRDEGRVGEMITVAVDFMRIETVSDSLLVSQAYLRVAPDGRVLAEADRAATALVAELRTRDEPERAGRVLYRLGGHYLDPYHGVPPHGHEARVELRRRLTAFLDPAEASAVDWATADMPAPTDALVRAGECYRDAAGLRRGAERGRALKALAQTMVARRMTGSGPPVEDEEIRSVARAALAVLDPDTDVDVMVGLRSVLDGAGIRLESGAASSRAGPKHPGGPVAARSSAFNTAVAAARQQAPDDPESALRDLLALDDEAAQLGQGSRRELWAAQRGTIAEIGIVRPRVGVLRRRPPPSPLSDLAACLREAVTLRSAGRDTEALAELDSADDLPAAWVGLAPAVTDLRMVLALNTAVDHVVSDPAAAAQHYTGALAHAVDLDLGGVAEDVLDRLGRLARDCAAPLGADVARSIGRGLSPLAERLLGWPATRHPAQLACQRVLGAAARCGVEETTADELRRILKGLSYAGALRAGAAYAVSGDLLGQQALALVGDLTDGPGIDAEDGGLFADEALLTSYTGVREVRAGRTRAERQANAQRAFDEHVFAALTTGASGDRSSASSVRVRACLDVNTALLDFVLVADQADRLLVLGWLHTRDGSHLLARADGELSALPAWEGDAHEVLAHPLAARVRAFREALQDYPGLGREVSAGATAAGSSLTETLMLQAGSELEDVRRTGCDHLVVVPHGPLHYVPFHLLPFGDGVLADAFTVTVLPNRDLQARPTQPKDPGLAPLAAFGMTFRDGGPFGLEPLTSAAEEVTEVARAFDAQPLLDSAATEAAVRAALVGSRRVHLSTHGRNTSAGAAFQLLYLWPDIDSDGRLHAYELLDLDLKGLEVVTLSACETALGRFDLLDNLRGLPAALLLRGAETIVGTLWEVDDQAAHTFFGEFYAALAAGSDRRAAFRAAQLHTRARLPHHRDWGAFYLIGIC